MATGPFDQSQQSAAKLPRDRRLARRLDCGIGGDPKQVNSGSLLPSPAVVTRTHRAIRDLIRAIGSTEVAASPRRDGARDTMSTAILQRSAHCRPKPR
jgi:hypothetical protein